MDLQLLNDLFANCIAASEILDIDKDFRAKVAKTQEQLAPMKIGKHGQLQEWQEDWDNPDNPHSHVSHLYGLYPSSQINHEETPKLFEAAKTSLIQRGSSGGWPGAWRISLWARVGNGDSAFVMLDKVMHGLADQVLEHHEIYILEVLDVEAGRPGRVFAEFLHELWIALEPSHDVDRERLFPWRKARNGPITFPAARVAVVVAPESYDARSPHGGVRAGDPLHDPEYRQAVGPPPLVRDGLEKTVHACRGARGLHSSHVTPIPQG